MMKQSILICFLIYCGSSFAQKGQIFPEIQAANLNAKVMHLPEDIKGKYSVIGVAFSEDAQLDLYSWGQPVYDLFMDNGSLNSMVYDVNVQLLLLFTGANKAAYNKAEKQIKEGSDKQFRDNILMYKGTMGDLRKVLKMKDRKVPYIYVLDKSGKIIYSTSGRYNKKKMDEISDLVAE